VPGWTRASELDRTLYCVGSKLVPATRLVSEGVKKAGAWGTFVHYWKETGELLDTSDFYESFKKTFDKKWDIVGSPELREGLWPSTGLHEVSYSYNCTTGAVASYTESGAVAWKDAHTEQFVCGTADYVGELDGLLWVDDLKTGALFNTPPDRSLQLYYYAACASIARFDAIHDTVVSITRWPKYPLSIMPERKWGFLPARRIEKFIVLLVSKYEEWLDGYDIAKFNPGDHCVFCPVECPLPLV
jgi:hypothetical protein